MTFLFEHVCSGVCDTRQELFTQEGHVLWWVGREGGGNPLLVFWYHGFDKFDAYKFVGGGGA